MEDWDIWISMKFTGPLFIPGSEDPNWILFDRMLLVKDSVKNVFKKPVNSSAEKT